MLKISWIKLSCVVLNPRNSWKFSPSVVMSCFNHKKIFHKYAYSYLDRHRLLMKFVWGGTSSLDWLRRSLCQLPTVPQSRTCQGAVENVSSFQRNLSMVRCSCVSSGGVSWDELNLVGGVLLRDSDQMWLDFGTWNWNRTAWWLTARRSCMTFELRCNRVLLRTVVGEKRRWDLESHQIWW